ncbi:MAG: leucine--tRNA ligase, partial [candidate division Zixibacteria bacterium]|nr:leucine--tRNA ligase [candidate division Zixibacteria bacterium]
MATSETAKWKYDFSRIESKWQQRWADENLYAAPETADPANKFYMLVMFLYPSGDIHMGHFRNYIIGDAVARYQMMLGRDVLHPFGWDSFGLPAERAAIQRAIHPQVWTAQNIAVSRATLQKAGISYDWSREVTSSEPDYYKWTQWMFVQLFKKGLAYRKKGFVNWCPEDRTVLANEQVKDGRCERCDTIVEKKDQVQWYFKITEYADQLLDDLNKLPHWPDNVRTMQREWIGRSYGTEVDFIIEDSGEKLPIFTTRPDTIYGVTYMAVAPEAELLDRLNLTGEYAERVAAYREKALRRTEIERASVTEEKDGVFTGKYVINPFNGERVQLWVADYVLAGYGTGAVMAVPAHDSRDFAFARKYGIPLKIVILPDADTSLDDAIMDDAFVEYGPMVNSDRFDGLAGKDALKAVTDYAEEKGFGRNKVNYKLKDWLISRQRYWGCPIPIIHCEKCGEVPVPESDLPVLLPKVDNFSPKGRSPLADIPEYMNVRCPSCGGEAQRDPDTMDTYVCSSWYYLRYADAHNDSEPFAREKADAWLPIDLYVGGITHATGHLIYYRFFHKFLRDIGMVNGDEPTERLFCLGMVMDENGEVMSKSKGNVVNPEPLIKKFGADTMRLYILFIGPPEKDAEWNDRAVEGSYRFLNRVYRLVSQHGKGKSGNTEYRASEKDVAAVRRKIHQTIKEVTEDMEGGFHFHTAISAIMELVNEIYLKLLRSDAGSSTELVDSGVVLKEAIQTVVVLLGPFVPHIAEEMWQMLGNDESVFKSSWPAYDPKALATQQMTIVVQVNSRVRGTVEVST